MGLQIRPDYLAEPGEIPAFWISTYDEIQAWLQAHVSLGKSEIIGKSAGGREIQAALYGSARQGLGTTTFSGALGCRDMQAYLGPEAAKKVYMGIGGVHGFELEGIVGVVNLINVLETGKDLRGTAWPEITETAKQLDRIMLIPLMNPDGRARVPMRMETNKGPDMDCHEYLNIGCWADGNRIVWPMCKTLIPMDFDQVEFPGGYPNDAGVNIQHDDFFGKRQPETEALFALCARERPDLIMHMHTGAPFRNYFMRMLRDFCEPALTPVFEQLYARVHTRLALEGLQSSNDPAVEADPTQSSLGPFNLTSALNLHCGALNVVMESPSHGFSGYDRQGELVTHSPEMLLDAQLYCHLEAMRFLAEKGGRIKWAPGRNRKA
jgi:hypothetical protein